MTIHEKRAMAGRLGGLATVRKYGREYMQAIGRRGAAALVERSTGQIVSTW